MSSRLREKPDRGRSSRTLMVLFSLALTVLTPTSARAGLGDITQQALESVGKQAASVAAPVSAVAAAVTATSLPPVADPVKEVLAEVAAPVDGLVAPPPTTPTTLPPPRLEQARPSDPGSDPPPPAAVIPAERSSIIADIGSGHPSSQNAPGHERRSQGDHSLLATLVTADPQVKDAASSTNAISSEDGLPFDLLSQLTGWLGTGVIGLLLAVPVKAFEILLRALFSAGAGLIAPASLLIAFALGALKDRRLFSGLL